MALNRRGEQKAATRARVLDAAGVCFRTTGFAGTGIRDIAREAGVTGGCVMGHFGDKATIYREVFGHAPITPEHGRALLLAARDDIQGRGIEALKAVVETVEEA